MKKKQKDIAQLPPWRPTLYHDDMPRQVLEYFADESVVAPTAAGLGVRLGVCKATIFSWMKDEEKSDFLDAVKIGQAYQEDKILTRALNGTSKEVTSIFVAKHNFGWNSCGYDEKGESGEKTVNNYYMSHDMPAISRNDGGGSGDSK